MRSVVVTGLGFVTCLGNDAGSVSASLRAQRHGIRRFPALEIGNSPVHLAGVVGGFDVSSTDQEDWTFPEDMPRLRMEQLRSLAPHGAYAIHACNQAIADAGLTPEMLSAPETGMYTASSGSSAMLYSNLDRMHRLGPRRCPPQGIVSSIAGTLSFNLISHFGITGASAGFVSACASSGHALGHAYDEIALGRQRRMIVVGAEDCNADTILPFCSLRVLSTSEDPDSASRPFDVKRDGFVGTGGAVTMILEDEGSALGRGAKIYARVVGWGQGSDGYHSMMPHPEGEGLARAMRNALSSAGMAPSGIAYLNAHATSTQAGDVAELHAIRSVFGTGSGPAVSSTKALTGHALSLSSVMECAFTVLAMNESWMPASAHITELDPAADGIDVIRDTREGVYFTAMSNSSGFGGANVSVIFKRA